MIDNGDNTYSALVTLRDDDVTITAWLDIAIIGGVPQVVDYDIVRVRVSDEMRHWIIADYLRAGRKPRREWRDDGAWD